MDINWKEGMLVVDAYTDDNQGRTVGVLHNARLNKAGQMESCRVTYGLLNEVTYGVGKTCSCLRPFWLQEGDWFSLGASKQAGSLRRVSKILWETQEYPDGNRQQMVHYQHLKDGPDYLWSGLAQEAVLADDVVTGTGKR